MNKMVRYEVTIPLIVSIMVGGKPQVLAVPEGGIIGFDGCFIYSRDTRGGWEKALTQKHYLLKWIENGTAIRLKDDTTQKTTPTLPQTNPPLQQEASPAEPGIPEDKGPVSTVTPLLPVVY